MVFYPRQHHRHRKGGVTLKNQKIRLTARAAGVPLWRLALELEVSEATITCKLRVELPEAEQRRILEIIDRLKDESAS